jgi:hypothetical protein
MERNNKGSKTMTISNKMMEIMETIRSKRFGLSYTKANRTKYTVAALVRAMTVGMPFRGSSWHPACRFIRIWQRTPKRSSEQP